MNEKTKSCPYCGTESTAQSQANFTYEFFTCPVCGRFECVTFPEIIGANIKDKVASYLYYTCKVEEHKDYRFFNFIGSKTVFDEQKAKYPWCHFVSVAEIEAFYPKTFSEKIDRILLGIAKKSQFLGDEIAFTKDEALSAMFMCRFDNKGNPLDEEAVFSQLDEISNYLYRDGYITRSRKGTSFVYSITPEGYKRIDELQAKEAKTSKNVFVAMSFATEMAEVREAIKTAILNNGYIPRIMDEIEHNHQIVPEMLYEIRKAKFVIAELTGHNNGAYFEAGYALGLGKEVIQVCSKERFGTDGHFDVKQINTILWDTTEELTKKLSARIEATIK